jgi:hypothetical protein
MHVRLRLFLVVLCLHERVSKTDDMCDLQLNVETSTVPKFRSINTMCSLGPLISLSLEFPKAVLCILPLRILNFKILSDRIYGFITMCSIPPHFQP